MDQTRPHRTGDEAVANVAHIAGLDPEVALALVEEVQRWREAERLRRDHEAYLVVIDTLTALRTRALAAEAKAGRWESAWRSW